MKIKVGTLRRILREEYCATCGIDHDDHAGVEPFWHDDDDAEHNPDHIVDGDPEGYQYVDRKLAP